MRFAYQSLPGEPDKLCDLVAAGIVDEYLRRDPETRIRCLVSGGHGALFITGELLTSADFDVSQLVLRLLATNGVYQGIEPFVALEPVPSARVGQFRQPCVEPIMLTGYATNETYSGLPAAVQLARDAAKLLDDKRINDPDWFWLGPAGSVTVSGEKKIDEVIVQVDHGTKDLSEVRDRIELLMAQAGQSMGEVIVKTNPLGPRDLSGLESFVGYSSAPWHPYGSMLPSLPSMAGHDPRHVNVAGQLLAHRAATELLKQTRSQAVMVQLMYGPGDLSPLRISARDERGKDLTENCLKFDLHLEHGLADWLIPGRVTEMVKWGF